MSRRIAVFTSTRADYSLLRPVLSALRDFEMIDLRLLVAGTHLSATHGMTVEMIEADGFQVSERIEMLVAGDSSTAATTSLALCTHAMGGALDRHRPDLLVVLGDRYETLGAAQAALVGRIPIAHIHGGELTGGAMDDSIRHAITKMSHLHFVASEQFGRRVAQLGEDPDSIHVVGAPGLDTVLSTDIASVDTLASDLGVDWGAPALLITMHPATLHPGTALTATNELIRALERLPDATLVLTGANADPEGEQINRRMVEFAATRAPRTVFVPSLGPKLYASAMRHAHAVVGNSSSGIIEAPAVGTPTVDIGDRQEGRPRATSVIHSGTDADSIAAAITAAIDPAFQAAASTTESLYGDGGAGPQIASILVTTEIADLLAKRFRDSVGARQDGAPVPSDPTSRGIDV